MAVYGLGSNVYVMNRAQQVVARGGAYDLWENEATTNTYSFTVGHAQGRNYLWAAEAGLWQKYGKTGETDTAPDDPSILLEPNNATPAAFADLLGWPMSDDYTGSGSNTGARDDTNYGQLYSLTQEIGGALTISGNKAVLTANSNPTQSVVGLYSQSVSIGADDFISTSDCEYVLNTADGNYLEGLRLLDLSSETSLAVRRLGGVYEIIARSGGGSSTTGLGSGSGSISFRIRRVSATVYLDYDTGGGWTNLRSSTGYGTDTSCRVLFQQVNPASAGSDSVGRLNTWDINDGTDTYIYDPTGSSV